jgi:cytochrome P450
VNHPEIQTRLLNEIDNVIGADRRPTLDDLTNLPFLDAVVHEILRYRPIIHGSAPAVVEEEIELQGGKYVIPVGTWCMMNIWGMLHDAAYWSEPERFIPQRFVDDPDLKRSPAFQPFRAGVRNCIGRFLAVTEMKLAVAYFFQRFTVAHPDGEGHKLVLADKDSVGLHKPPANTRIRIIRRN